MAEEKPEEQNEDAKPAEGEAAAPAAPAVPADNLPPLEPIVVKKKIEGDHAGAHGGAWKIALADMMTAMMAFFLLMWLLSATNEDQRKSIAEYFKPSSHSAVQMSTVAGTSGIMGGQSLLDPDGMPYHALKTAPSPIQVVQIAVKIIVIAAICQPKKDKKLRLKLTSKTLTS
jgi:chemotaxis protein MotB